MAKKSNTLILSKDSGDVPNMVGQAMQIYKSISASNQTTSEPQSSEYYSDAEEFKNSSDKKK